MSEANLLNPTQSSLLSPWFGYTEGWPQLREETRAAGGKKITRPSGGLGRIYENLVWPRVDKATMHALKQWEQQYASDFFTLWDYERNRGFSGHFAAPLRVTPQGNEMWDVTGVFEELPGLPLFAYPSDWARDAIFLEERNGFAEDLVKLIGGDWTFSTDPGANPHGGGVYFSKVTNETAEWLYFGYGCRVWFGKQSNMGEAEVTVTRTRDGAAVAGPTTVDLYAAVDTAAAALFTAQNLALDEYRVKLRVKGTKNASSTDFFIFADALEVMK